MDVKGSPVRFSTKSTRSGKGDLLRAHPRFSQGLEPRPSSSGSGRGKPTFSIRAAHSAVVLSARV